MRHFASPRAFYRALIAFLVALTLSACSLADEPQPAGPIQVGPLPTQASQLAPVSLPDLADGAQIFADHCAACHGSGGKGDGPQAAGVQQQGGHVPDLTNPAFAHASSPKAWFATITNGNIAKLMPPWAQALNDQQRWDVAYYVSTFSEPTNALDAGKAAYTANCESCHAADGSKNGLTDAAKMAALSPQELYDQYVANGTDGVHTFADKIDEATRWSVVAYARSFSYHAAASAAPTALPTGEPSTNSTPGGTPAPTSAAAPGVVGSVSGKISNGTPGGSIPPDLSAALSGVALDATGNVSEFVNKTSPVAADGSFQFDGLPFDKGKSAYIVTVTYNGLQFENFQQVDPAKTSIDLPVTIYDATADTSAVSLDAVHYFFSAHQNSLLVVQVMIFSNSSDKAYMSASKLPTGQAASVAFGLPADATSLSFDTGELGARFIASGGLIYDTQPLLPGKGSDTISATYIVPYDNGRDFSIPIQYKTGLVNVLLPPEMQIRGGNFAKGADKSFQGQTLSAYTMQNLPAGQPLNFHLGSSPQLLDVVRIVLAILLVILIASAIVYWLMRRSAAQAVPVPSLGGESGEALLRQIAELDESFRAGTVNRFDYEAHRAELKAQLVELIGEPD